MERSDQQSNQVLTSGAHPAKGQDVRRRAWEGKSIAPDFDILLTRPKVVETDVEVVWGEKKAPVPDLLIWLSVVAIGLIALGAYFSLRADSSTSAMVEMVEDEPNEQGVVQTHYALQTTIKNYLQADTIEKKLIFVRNSAAVKTRMEHYYSAHPLVPQDCLSLVRFESFFYQDRQFWHVTAQIDDKMGLMLMLEEIAPDQFLVDWESHVDYQPMPWEQYISEKPILPMSFRVQAEHSNYYGYEFANENRWDCYKLSQPKRDEILYGYVLRGSTEHQKILNALSNGPKRVILRLQLSKGMASKNAVVIKDVVSDSIYRIDPPSSLDD